ncbi:N-formylglutamate amidohydrolase [Roseibium algae]|uniref:N-formylglutamate amidohydrolase n=1 Tax=Roseibium algae TaxID=3123038 RepID=A0ABU8TRJ2_9HYPH
MIIVEKGASPLILCLPHSGVDIPPAIETRLSATGRLQADISWRLEKVLDIARELDATIIRSTISRYVIDVDQKGENPDEPMEAPFGPLCPTSTLDLKRIYKADEEPGFVEIDQRKLLFYFPFHNALEQEIGRLRKLHDQVVLFDCQSIRSRIRGFVEGELPVINIGTGEGSSCADGVKDAFAGSFAGLSGFSVSIDGQFKGGHILRRYADPLRGLHAMTLVIAQRVYLRHESPPFEPDKARIARLKTVLIDGFSKIIDWAKIDRTAQVCSSLQTAKQEGVCSSDNAGIDYIGPAETVAAKGNDEIFEAPLPSAG